MVNKLRVASYNIHKGLSAFNRRLVVHEVRHALKKLSPDLVFLQEVQGAHRSHAHRFETWPDEGQHLYLAGDGLTAAYGRNANYQHGHHGNALLSRFPIRNYYNHDLTLHRFEQRGLLHCQLDLPDWNQPLHALCVHLNLLGHDRRKQLAMLVDFIGKRIPKNAPMVLAGDFNDWRRESTRLLGHELGVVEAFEALHGDSARSFPARMPLLSLDRVYVRGFQIEAADVLSGAPWAALSDHAPLYTVLHRGQA
ncbi:hypothetical protein BJP62_01540 [Jeongeupia sp. USM3]|nr:hypothetical protein BJP62_01540 [Jeongeupia sp. USM3]